MPGQAFQSFWFGTLGTFGTLVVDGTLLVFTLDPLALLEYATIHNNVVTWFKNDLRLPLPRINLLKCYRGDHGGCPIQKGLQACLKKWLHQNSFARQ
jgi:hypothetical protein